MNNLNNLYFTMWATTSLLHFSISQITFLTYLRISVHSTPGHIVNLQETYKFTVWNRNVKQKLIQRYLHK